MRKYLGYVLAAVIGVAIGCAVGYDTANHLGRGVEVKTDTLFVYDTVSFGRDELADATTEITPEVVTEYIRVPEITIKREVVHDTTFIVLPRQQYYTEKNGVHIWHSGVQSRIDSLDYVERHYVIKQVHIKKRPNTITAGVGAAYTGSFRLPVELRYTRAVNDWFAVYGFAEYDILHKQFGGGLGGEFKIAW